jgi:hypothetical protein
MKRLALVALALIGGAACRSSAPYTVPAVALNLGVAAGVAGVQRAAGGCYAVCTNGRLCNPKTGFCEVPSPRDLCEPVPGGNECIPLDIRTMARERQAAVTVPTPPIGLSPATGTVPPPPAEASPALDR